MANLKEAVDGARINGEEYRFISARGTRYTIIEKTANALYSDGIGNILSKGIDTSSVYVDGDPLDGYVTLIGDSGGRLILPWNGWKKV